LGLGCRQIFVEQGDSGSGSCQRIGNRRANAMPAAGDNGRLPCE
jgi:hypothetical protein